MRIACVVQRYGPDITGGSETHCRQIAARLATRHEVEVLTTCAADYVHWRNALPAGWSSHSGVRVGRFPVARRRHLHAFAEASERAFSRRHTIEDERTWVLANGPESPALLDHLRRHGSRYDVVAFWAYRYYHTFLGLPTVADRAVLVPTAEDDPVLDFALTADLFSRPRGFLFLTDEERDLVLARAGPDGRPWAVVGTGLEPPAPVAASVLDPLGLPDDFILYVGRVDRNKGCETLVRHFLRHLAETGAEVTLVLAGPVHASLPAHRRVRVLGAVSEAVREALYARARLLVMPSPYESLCIALLEAWNRGLAALVNGRCAVLRGQVERAQGGLHYSSYPEFTAALTWLLDHPEETRRLGHQGQRHVEATYRWPRVMAKVEALLDAVANPRHATAPASA